MALSLSGDDAAFVPVVVRNERGVVVASGEISLLAQGQTSFLLSSRFPESAQLRGTLEFTRPTAREISLLGLRFPSTGGFSAQPIFAPSTYGISSGTHFAVGEGWQSNIVLVNTSAAEAQFTLTFHDDQGKLAPVLVSYPQTLVTETVTSLHRALPAGATLLVNTAATPALQSGSFELDANAAMSGLVRLTWFGHEATVPLEARMADYYTIPFDNIDQLANALAIANLGTAANISVLARDAAGKALGSTVVHLEAKGHTAFLLADQIPATAHQRGTITLANPLGGRISALGLQVSNSSQLVNIPVLVP
jgi:hypothetical protein